tara:strand:- start:8 stop:130 length:123 start_codon:yes stop_codon:yes gene_type:complete
MPESEKFRLETRLTSAAHDDDSQQGDGCGHQLSNGNLIGI